jgi:hypothetical protein
MTHLDDTNMNPSAEPVETMPEEETKEEGMPAEEAPATEGGDTAAM